MACTWTSIITWPQKHREIHQSHYFLLSQSEASFSCLCMCSCGVTGKLRWSRKLSAGFPWLIAEPCNTAVLSTSHLVQHTFLSLTEHFWDIFYMDTCSIYILLSCHDCWYSYSSHHQPVDLWKGPSHAMLVFQNISLRSFASSALRMLTD